MKYLGFALLFSALIFAGISCENSTLRITSSSQSDGGVYQSKDQGDTWEQKVFVSQVGKKTNTIAGVNVINIMADFSDSRILYLITREHGVWRTSNSGDEWAQVYGGGAVHALSAHPSDAQILYLAAGNTVQKSVDSGQNWREVYLEPRGGVGVTGVVVDATDPRHILCATSAGDILESRDSGESWQAVYRFEGAVVSLVRSDSAKTFFAATPSQGLWRSSDEGRSWREITESLKDLPGGRDFRAFIPDTANSRSFMLVTAYGIFRTANHGDTWDQMSLIAPPGKSEILSVAVNPKNSSHVYYAVPGALYRSLNGGTRWTTLPLPSGKLPTSLLVDHFNPNIVYMGFSKPAKK